MTKPSLPALVALARAGAVDAAWRQFEAAGYQTLDDPAALSVKGRLCKDRARLASSPAERKRLFGEAAGAYARAAELSSATYPLINAATLLLLSGDAARARRLAADVLARIEEQPDEPETPYYRAATAAEALLLLGREEAAQQGLAEAIGLAPEAWEDHASTLRQFRLIAEELGADAAWLDRHRPPPSLHFGGHMSFSADSPQPELAGEIAKVLEEERIGFGYGALAAGADIIIAEALLERGAELHLILPGGAAAFAARSVDPSGPEWRKRFDSVLDRASTVRPVRPIGTLPDTAMIALGDEVAMGAALMNARRLESGVVQLLVVDPGSAPAVPKHVLTRSRVQGARDGWRRRLIAAPREAIARGKDGEAGSSSHRPLALLAVALDGEGAAALGEHLRKLRGRLRLLPRPLAGPWLEGGELLFVYGPPADAAAAAVMLAREGHSVGGDYAVADLFQDPFAGTERVPAGAAGAASAAARSAPAGSACVTEDFAAALAAAAPGAAFPELVGELDGEPPIALFALRGGS